MLRIFVLLALSFAMFAADAPPVIVNPTTGATQNARPGDRLVLPTSTAGSGVTLDPGVQNGPRTLGVPALLGPDAILTGSSNTTSSTPEGRAFYPQSVYRLPVAQRANLQSALDTYGAVRLDSADYTAGVPFGTTITMRSGYRLYGPGGLCVIPMINIAPGASGVVLSGINGFGGNQTVTFAAGAQISNCLFRHILYASFQGTGPDVEACTWMGCSNSQLTFDCSAGGHFSNNRILGTLSQNTVSEIVIKGNPANPSVGNQVGAHASLSSPASDSIIVTNSQNFSAWLLNVERYSVTNNSVFMNLASSVTSARVFSVGGYSPTSSIYTVNAPIFWKLYDYVNPSGAVTTAFGSTALRSTLLADLNESSNTSTASSPDRFSLFNNNAFLVKNNASTVSSALTGTAATDFAAINYPPRTEPLWAAPSWDVKPANPLGDQWASLVPNLPDASAYIQGLIATNGVAILGPGVYKIVTPIKINDGQGIIGAGMHKTVLVAATTSTDLIVNDQAITGSSQHITITDLTLQGGANGIHHSAVVNVSALTQFSGMVLSHVCFRDMTNAGMFLDQIYAWDNNTVSNCDFVNCAYGQRSNSQPSAANNNIAYIDKQTNFHNRYLECGYGVYYTEPNRADNADTWIGCQFANCTVGASFGDQMNQMGFVNCVFTNNAGNPSVNVTSGDLDIIGCNFNAGQVSSSSLIQGKTLFVLDSTFTKGLSTGTVVFGPADSFGNSITYVSNSNLVDIQAGTSVFQHFQSINSNYGAGDYPALNVGWAFQLAQGGGFITGVSTTSNPIPQMLRGASQPAVLERFQTIDAQGLNTPYTPENVTAASGGGSFISTGSVTTRVPADRAADVWNVQDFGCIADGTTAGAGTDNAAALAAAVTAAHAIYVSNGHTVTLSLGKGLYALNTTVAWQSGVRLVGPGGLVVKNASTYTGAMHDLISCNGLTDVAFEDVQAWGVGPDRKLAGSCTDNSALGGNDGFVDLTNCLHVFIKNCKLFRFQLAIEIGQTSDVQIIGNYINSLSSKTLAQLDNGSFTDYSFTGNPGGGISYLGQRAGVNQTESDNIIISGNTVICVGLDVAIDCTSQSGYPFRANVIGNYCAGTNSGIQIYTSGSAIPDPGTLTTTDRGLNITGNSVCWTRQQGIYIRGVESVNCTSNKVTRCATLGTFVGTSAGGILCRATTIATFPTSPVSHDLPVQINDNQIVDCGNPTSGVLDAGIRCDMLNGCVKNNQIYRSFDRFGSNLTVSGSTGIVLLTTHALDHPRYAEFTGNKIRGFNVGISSSYIDAIQLGKFTVDLKDNRITKVVTGINVNTKASGYHIDRNSISECTSIGIYLKNTPYSTINENGIDGSPIGIQLDAGNMASDYWVTGGRMGATLELRGNHIDGATTPIGIASTATGDISVRSRCLIVKDNLIDGSPFNRDGTGSMTYTAAPTASDYRIWHIGDKAPVRTPTSAGPDWVCITAGSFGATIATTASTTSGSPLVTFSALTAVVPDDYINIAGVTGNLHVLSVNVAANQCTVDVNASATVSGAAITRPAPVFDNKIPVTQGGTGATSFTAYGVVIGGTTSTGALQSLVSLGTTGWVLTSNGAGAAPSFQAPTGGGGGTVPTGTGFTHITSASQDAAARAVNLASADVTGVTPQANGGTGVNNAGTLTVPVNTSITGGGTIALGGFTATVAKTGTLANIADFAQANLTAVVDPTLTDDNTTGYSVGSFWLNTATNTIFQAANVTTGAAVWTSLRPGAFPYTDVYSTVGSATFTKHPGTNWVAVYVQGAGGGGGSGALEASGVVACGGGGAGGGDYIMHTFPASLINTTEPVVIGDGGAGGAAQSTSDTNGNNGGTGSITTFGTTGTSWIQASGGSGGAGGTTTTGTAGGGSNSSGHGGGAGGAASTTGGAGSNGNRPFEGGAGGGSGGGVSSADAASNGGNGAYPQNSSSYGSSTGAGTAPGGAGSAGASPVTPWATAGVAGGGGAGGVSVNGGTGGAGGIGSGGGGGGGSRDGHSSGTGGKGGKGTIVVLSW